MKIIVKDIQWNVTEEQKKIIEPLFIQKEKDAKNMFEQGKIDEDRLIKQMLDNGELEEEEDYEREYTSFSEYFDKDTAISEIIEYNLGLPTSTVIDVPDDYTVKDIYTALSDKYGYEAKENGSLKYDKARGNEVAKQEMIDAVDNIVNSDDFKAYLDLAENFKNYSTKNKLLVFHQKPNATMVKGMYAWRNEYERSVNKGATAIWIYTPSMVKFNGAKDMNSFISFAKQSRENVWIPVVISETKEAEYLQKLQNGEKLEFIKGFSVAPVFDVSDTHGKEFDFEKKDTKLNDDQINHILMEYCADLDINPSITSFETLKKITSTLLYGEKILVPTISGNMDINNAKRELEIGAVSYIVGKQLGLDTTNHSLESIAKAFENDAPGARFTVFTQLYERIDKTAEYIIKNLENYKENEHKEEHIEEQDEYER